MSPKPGEVWLADLGLAAKPRPVVVVSRYDEKIHASQPIFNKVEMIDKSLSVQIKDRPKICAIDVEQEIVEALQAKGLHCFSGTLGSQFKVPNSGRGDSHICLSNHRFPPNLHEYDIVIIDLQSQKPIEYIESNHTHIHHKGSEKIVLSSSYPETIFDPRPLASNFFKDQLQDFFKEKTLMIVFCSKDYESRYFLERITDRGSYRLDPEDHYLYEFIPCLQGTSNKTGEKNKVIANFNENLKLFLEKYSRSFIYEIVFGHPTEWSEEEKTRILRKEFIPLLLNSQDKIIGFVDFSLNSSAVFGFPQLKNDKKKDFILELVDELLPELFPQIFPYSEQFSWLKREKYLLPNQADLLTKRAKLEDEYKKAVANIEEDIQKNQIEYQWLHDLITETGDSLVKSVEKFFVYLGFENVVNMDENNPKIKEEDLQVSLDSGLLVVEIKGIGGTSKDSECSQISKIKSRRAEERGKFDVVALYIVNHQRYLPPGERKNPPFSEQQIADAQLEKRGLITTYNLFKLYFNIEESFVAKKEARDSLLKYGLVQFKPSKASLIGCPLEVHHKGQVVILNIDNILLYKGASIIVCDDEAWFRVKILEMRANDETVESISEGEIGVKLSRSVLKTSELWLEDTIIGAS